MLLDTAGGHTPGVRIRDRNHTTNVGGINMNRDRVAGNWKRFSGLLREQWGRLSGDQSAVDAGKRDQLAGKVQARHGVSKDETERQVRDFLYRNRNWDLSRRGNRP